MPRLIFEPMSKMYNLQGTDDMEANRQTGKKILKTHNSHTFILDHNCCSKRAKIKWPETQLSAFYLTYMLQTKQQTDTESISTIDLDRVEQTHDTTV